MSQHPVVWLADVLEDAGCKVKRYVGWKERGRPESSGGFDPVGVLIHHTGTTTSAARPAPTVPLCIAGRPDLPGPLCQVVLGFDGLFHVIAAGRANHAGTAKASGPVPGGDGNSLYIGIEVDYSGSQDMGSLQHAALIKGTAAILERLGKSADWARGHKETSSAGKWDPGRRGSSSPEYLMGPMRTAIGNDIRPPTRPRFEMLSGEGRVMATSARSGTTRSKQKERALAFYTGQLDKMLDEMDSDKRLGEPEDIRIRRMWG